MKIIITRKMHILFHLHKNTLFLLPTLTHLQGPYSLLVQEIFQRCFPPIFHTHFLFQSSTLRQFTFTFTFCYFCVKSHLKEPTKFSNHMERGRKVNMSLRHVKVSFGEEVLRILVPLRTF